MTNMNIFNELSEHVTIKINSCSEQIHDANWLENKVHYDYDIWLILEGVVFIQIDGMTHTAREGDVVLFYPGIPYTASAGLEGCRFLFIHFEFMVGNNIRILDECNMTGIIPAQCMEEEAKRFHQYWLDSKQSEVPAIMLKGYFTVLLSKLMDICSKEQVERIYFPQLRQSKNRDRMATLEPIIKFITDNLGRRIKVIELSTMLNMSEKYFIHYFSNTIGVTPLVYMNQVKMNKAKVYLYQGRYSIKEISYMLGYADQYTFSKAFKKHYHVSPSNFI
jgi:AraC family transcriptional regulator